MLTHGQLVFSHMASTMACIIFIRLDAKEHLQTLLQKSQLESVISNRF